MATTYSAVSTFMATRFGFRVEPILAAEALVQLYAGAGVHLHQGRHCVRLRRRAAAGVIDVFGSAEEEVGPLALEDVLGAMSYAKG